jgi:hypothetical protein
MQVLVGNTLCESPTCNASDLLDVGTASNLCNVHTTESTAKYEKLAYNTAGCDSGAEVATLSECEEALAALGLQTSTRGAGTLTGSADAWAPPYCSVREPYMKASEPTPMGHFNYNSGGSAQEDFAPICFANRFKQGSILTDSGAQKRPWSITVECIKPLWGRYVTVYLPGYHRKLLHGGIDVYGCANEEDQCAKVDGGGWQLVRHAGSSEDSWPPWDDDLAGTNSYNAPTDTNKYKQLTSWTIPWQSHKVRHFLFAFGDCSKWVIAEPAQVYGEKYNATSSRWALKSQASATPFQVKWTYRTGASQDPIIKVSDSDTYNIYAEGNYSIYSDDIANMNEHKGANVYIRQWDSPSWAPEISVPPAPGAVWMTVTGSCTDSSDATTSLESLDDDDISSVADCLEACAKNAACGAVTIADAFDDACTLHGFGFTGNDGSTNTCYIKAPLGVIVPNCSCTGCEDYGWISTSLTDYEFVYASENQTNHCINACRKSRSCVRAHMNERGCQLYSQGANKMKIETSSDNATLDVCWVAHTNCMVSRSTSCDTVCFDGTYDNSLDVAYIFYDQPAGSWDWSSTSPYGGYICTAYTSGDGSGRDDSHTSGVLRSRPFVIISTTTINITVYGGSGSASYPGSSTKPEDGNTPSGSTSTTGFLGVALYDVASGDYLSWVVISSEGTSQVISWATSDLTAWIGREISVDVIDTYHLTSGYGYIAVSQLVLAGACAKDNEFVCGSEDDLGVSGGCPACVLNQECFCQGIVKFTTGDESTDWRAVTAEESLNGLSCSTTNFPDPDSASKKYCVCNQGQRVIATSVAYNISCDAKYINPNAADPLPDYYTACFCMKTAQYDFYENSCVSGDSTSLVTTTVDAAIGAWTLQRCISQCEIESGCSAVQWKKPTEQCRVFLETDGTSLLDVSFWNLNCLTINGDAKFLTTHVGSVVDYFRPASGKSFCDMLTSHDSHEWSNDGETWYTPGYHSSQLGGSSGNWPNSNVDGDSRERLFFWGTTTAQSSKHGGWGQADLAGSVATAWYHAFSMSWCRDVDMENVATGSSSCSRSSSFCIGSGDTYMLLDCDDDGQADPVCITSTNVTWLSNSNSCSESSTSCTFSGISSSSSSCSCTLVNLNGVYSAGALMQCTSCTDVYKSTDTNSCPTGWKLFSPRSQEDWDTVIASVTLPVAAPHFIVDVTKDTDGCDTCANTIGNSDDAAMAMFTTTDGSPWWIRSTQYPEPSGDYEANCYMAVTSYSQGGGSITYNDKTCEYHSTDYLCQPEMAVKCKLIRESANWDRTAAKGSTTDDTNACYLKPNATGTKYTTSENKLGYYRKDIPSTNILWWGRDTSDSNITSVTPPTEHYSTETTSESKSGGDLVECSYDTGLCFTPSYDTMRSTGRVGRICSVEEARQAAYHICVAEADVNFTLLGDEKLYIPKNLYAKWTDPGVVCQDSYGDDLNVSITYSDTTDVAGSGYTTYYACKDATLTRTVVLFDYWLMNGFETWYVQSTEGTSMSAGTTWTDPQGTCKDDSANEVAVSSSHGTSFSLAPTGSTQRTFTITYSCRRRWPEHWTDPTRTLHIRDAHVMYGNNPWYMPISSTRGPVPISESSCFDDYNTFHTTTATITSISSSYSASTSTSIDRTSAVNIIITYSGCPDVDDIVRTLIVREPIILYGDNPQRVRTTTASIDMYWDDPGGDCVDDAGTYGNITADPSIIPRGSGATYNITYSCDIQEAPYIYRDLEVRDACVLYGNATQQFPLDTTWIDPGASCITDDGEYVEVSVSPSSLTLDTVGTNIVTYSCRRREWGGNIEKTRNVTAREAFILFGPKNHIVRLTDTYYDDPGANCLSDDSEGGVYLAVDSRRRFIRDTVTRTAWYYGCRRRIGTTIIRYITVREAFYLLEYNVSGGWRQNESFQQRIQASEDSDANWSDPGADCITDEGEQRGYDTRRRFSIYGSTRRRYTEFYNITYSCRRRETPDLYRWVEVRDAFVLVGRTNEESRTVDMMWVDPGATCIDSVGIDASYTVAGDGFNVGSGGSWTVTYTCSSASDFSDGGVLERIVTTRDALILYGGDSSDNSVIVRSDDGVTWSAPSPDADCIDDYGFYMSVTTERRRFVLTSPGRAAMTTETITYSCRRRATPDIDRSIYVRDAIRVFGNDPLIALVEGEFDAPNPFTDPGTDAIDDDGEDETVDADPSSIYTNCDPAGCNYTVTYSCRRRETPDVYREIEVRHPVRINGPNPQQLLVGGEFGAPDNWTDQGASCLGREESYDNLTVTVTPSTLSREAVTFFYITYSCTDSSSRSAEYIRTVEIIRPITFNFGNPQYALQDSSGTWSDPGHWCVQPSPMDEPLWINLTATWSPSDGTLSLASLTTLAITYSCTNNDSSYTSTLVRAVYVVEPITLYGDDPEIVLVSTGNTWTDPGIRCTGSYGETLDYTYSPSSLSLNSAGYLYMTYSCTESDGSVYTKTRTVIVTSGTPGTFIRGPATAYLALNEYYEDPTACCVDENDQTTSDPVLIGSVDRTIAGPNTLIYQCYTVDGAAAASVERKVVVNTLPSVVLTTTSDDDPIIVTPGSDFTDDGAYCYDPEDGMISVYGNGYSGTQYAFRAGASDITSGKADNVIDGDQGCCSSSTYTATDIAGGCPSCVTATLVWIDLGVSRTVYYVSVYGTITNGQVYIGDAGGTETDYATLCRSTTFTIASSSVQVICDSARAGRYVTVVASDSSSITACEIEVTGTAGPAAPVELNVVGDSSSCTLGDSDGTMLGTFLANDVNETHGVIYHWWNGSAWGINDDAAIIQREEDIYMKFEWVLRDGTGAICATAPGYAQYPPMTGWTIQGSGTCTSMTIQYDPEDMCSWLLGLQSTDDTYTCGDDTTCSSAGCCLSSAATLKWCPRNLPWMCEDQSSDCGGDYCCASDTAGCASYNGVRTCKQSMFNGTLEDDVVSTTVVRQRIETTSAVDTNVLGLQKVIYTCVDSAGGTDTVARDVMIGCETPNPTGTYGGNSLNSCDSTDDYYTCPSYENCATACLYISTCEGYTWQDDTLVCQMYSSCDGKYTAISDENQYASVCRRFDKPPEVVLADGSDEYILQSATWTEADYACTDAEDSPYPTCIRSTSDWDVDTAGTYIITYSCTDSAGSTTYDTRSLVVQASCAVPTDDNADSSGFCEEGSANMSRGETCTLQCDEDNGYQASVPTVICTSDSDTKSTSWWSTTEEGAEESPSCGSTTCSEPTVSYSIGWEDDFVEPCEESLDNYNAEREGQVVDGGYCTANCMSGYVAEPSGALDWGCGGPSSDCPARLQCASGSFTDSLTYYCYLPSTTPLSIYSTKQNYVDMDVAWIGDQANDCTFNGWDVYASRLDGTEGTAGDGSTLVDYTSISECTAAETLAAGRATLTCSLQNLVEGGTYVLKVRESCSNDLLDSDYVTSAAYTLSYVWPPEILLSSPTGTGLDGVLSSPGQIVLAVSVSVIQGESGGGQIKLERLADTYCDYLSFITEPEDVVDGSPELGQVGLVNGRIFLILPDSDFFEPGCDYDVTFEADSMQTEEVGDGTKGNDEFYWQFRYIDEVPVLGVLSYTAQEITETGIEVTMVVNYHLASTITCTTTSDDDGTVYTNSDLQQYTDTEVVSFTISSLVPDSGYTVSCTGYKYGKTWVVVEDSTAYTFTSDKDTNTDMNPISIMKYSICTDSSGTNTSYEVDDGTEKTETQLSIGDVLLILSWEGACNGYDSAGDPIAMSAGDSAYMRFEGSVTAWSQYATVYWDMSGGNGPNLDFYFTKAADDENRTILTQTLTWHVCPHAYVDAPNTYPCKEYSFILTCVDLSLSIDGGSGRRLKTTADGRRMSDDVVFVDGLTDDTQAVDDVQCGSSISFSIYCSDDVLDWSSITIFIGSDSDSGFPQTYTYASTSDSSYTTVTLDNIQGTGVWLPIIFEWMQVMFDMKTYLNFAAPTMVVTPLTALLTTVDPTVYVTFGDVPTEATAIVGTTCTPAAYLQIKVVKDGEDTQLCGSTIFADTDDWTTAYCVIQPAALSPLIVKIEMWDVTGADWYLSPDRAIEDTVIFTMPGFTSLIALDEYGVAEDGTADLNLVPAFSATTGARQTAQIQIIGTNFPAIDVEQTGAEMYGYQLWLQPPDGTVNSADEAAPEIGLCVLPMTVVDTETLLCDVVECLDVRYLELAPPTVLQLGDLRSDPAMQNLIMIPRPVVTYYTPTSTLDVGTTEFYIVGEFLGIPCELPTTSYDDVDCADACTTWIAAGEEGTGAVQTFGNITATVTDATCVSQVQNDTHIICTTSTSLRAQRDDIDYDAGEVIGAIRVSADVEIAFTVGTLMSPTAEMTVGTTLMQCSEGQQRTSEDEDVCEDCVAGQYSSSSSDQWPLLCSCCDSSSYQDSTGMTECEDCPANTESGLPPDSIDRCMCIAGFYSQYMDDWAVGGRAGKPCISCANEDHTDDPPLGSYCSQEIVNMDTCTAPSMTSCAREDDSSYTYRMCTLYCAGGTNWPAAKPGYYINGQSEITDDSATNDTVQHKPVIETCDPWESCSAGNVCGAGYTGTGCTDCQAFPLTPYWRDSTDNTCVVCGDEQTIGTIIMGVLGIVGTLGAFLGSLFYMKMNADPVFKNMVQGIAKGNLVRPLLAMIQKLGLSDLNKRKMRITFQKTDLLSSKIWIAKKDLGMIFRCSPEERRVYVCGVRENSPAMSAGIIANWRLVLVNGHAAKSRTEDELMQQIAMAHIPIDLAFRIPPQKDEGEEDAGEAYEGAKAGGATAAKGMRMLTMTLGVLQSFKSVMSLDMEWPPLFTAFAEIVAALTMNFNFFAPECSVSAPYEQTWAAFVIMPYCMVFPISFSGCSLWLIHVIWSAKYRKDPDFACIQDWMVKNTVARTLLLVMLLFVNFHFSKLIEAFSCAERSEGSGVYVLVANQATECVMSDDTYYWIFLLSFVGWSIVCMAFSFLFMCLYQGYYWQTGCRVRDRMPFFLAICESSTEDM